MCLAHIVGHGYVGLQLRTERRLRMKPGTPLQVVALVAIHNQRFVKQR